MSRSVRAAAKYSSKVADAVIEQAKGILMGQRHCTAEEVFDILMTLSQDTNRKLGDLALALADHTVGTG